MATNSEVGAVVAKMAARYPHVTLAEETVLAWIEDFAGWDGQRLMDAAMRHVRDEERGRYFPSVADILHADRCNQADRAVVARIEGNARRMLERAEDVPASPETIEATKRALGLTLRRVP